MKALSVFFFTFIVLFSCSSKKSSVKGPMNISEIYTYTNQANTKCTEKLKNENTEIVLIGFINKLTTDSTTNSFDIFESPDDITSKRFSILITANAEKIFNKISKQLDKAGETNYIKIKIKGTILGKPLYINADCKMGTFLTISDLDNISF